MRRSFGQLAQFAAIVCGACGVVAGASADNWSMQGITVASKTVASSPVSIVLHLKEDGKMVMVTVTHQNRTVTILPKNWRHDLERHLLLIRRDFGKEAATAATGASWTRGLNAPVQDLSELRKIMEQSGFTEEERQTSYREPSPMGL